MPKIISKKEAADIKAVYQDGTPVAIVKNSEPVPLEKALNQLCGVLTEFKTPTITVEPATIQTKDYTKLLQQIEESLSMLLAREIKEPVINFQANVPDVPVVKWEFEIIRDSDGRMKSIFANPV